ncbi:MAG: TSUP family transporter [Proteobacteria bacterium]|nr:TSUP family transporter [Pseudomonadota bacterium]
MVYLVLILIGFIAGFIDTVAGGGGMITLPAYLMAGLPPHWALGTNKLSGTLSVANAARVFIKKKIFLPQYWLPAIIATFSGGAIGSISVHFLSSGLIKKALPAVIFTLAIYVIVPKKYQQPDLKNYQPSKFSSSLLGSFLGFYDGFLGPGTGSFWVVALMACYKINIIEATAITKMMNTLSSTAALIVFISYGNVHFALGLAVAASMMAGAYFGAHSAIRWGGALVRPLFLIIVIGIAITLAIQTWS